MMASRSLAPVFRTLLIGIAASGLLLAATGCGNDNPASRAGSIELPRREAPRVDAKSFAKDQARQRGQNP